jgi:hypothetical protein
MVPGVAELFQNAFVQACREEHFRALPMEFEEIQFAALLDGDGSAKAVMGVRAEGQQNAVLFDPHPVGAVHVDVDVFVAHA